CSHLRLWRSARLHAFSPSMLSPMLFKYNGNIRRILWNCSSPDAKFRSSDCCAIAGTENRQARKQAMYTRSILVLLSVGTDSQASQNFSRAKWNPTAGCTILKRAAHDHANVQRFDE